MEDIRKGSPWKVDAIGIFGLLLFWHQTRSSTARATTSLASWLAAPCTSNWLCSGCQALLHALWCCPAASVSPPILEDINRCIEVVANCHMLLGGEQAWAACNGSKFSLLQRSSHQQEQNPFFSGWSSHTRVNSSSALLVASNCPGPGMATHKQTMASAGRLRRSTLCMAGRLLWTLPAFGFQSKTKNCLIKSLQADPARHQ